MFLNLPLGSRYIIHVLNEEKAQRPYIDKVAPFTRYYRWAIFNDPEAVLRITARSLGFVGAGRAAEDPAPRPDAARGSPEALRCGTPRSRRSSTRRATSSRGRGTTR